MLINDSKQAFDNAIALGKLTAFSSKKNYAGNYMYMYSDEGEHGSIIDYFKNIDTRKYDIQCTNINSLVRK